MSAYISRMHLWTYMVALVTQAMASANRPEINLNGLLTE